MAPEAESTSRVSGRGPWPTVRDLCGIGCGCGPTPATHLRGDRQAFSAVVCYCLRVSAPGTDYESEGRRFESCWARCSGLSRPSSGASGPSSPARCRAPTDPVRCLSPPKCGGREAVAILWLPTPSDRLYTASPWPTLGLRHTQRIANNSAGKPCVAAGLLSLRPGPSKPWVGGSTPSRRANLFASFPPRAPPAAPRLVRVLSGFSVGTGLGPHVGGARPSTRWVARPAA